MINSVQPQFGKLIINEESFLKRSQDDLLQEFQALGKQYKRPIDFLDKKGLDVTLELKDPSKEYATRDEDYFQVESGLRRHDRGLALKLSNLFERLQQKVQRRIDLKKYGSYSSSKTISQTGGAHVTIESLDARKPFEDALFNWMSFDRYDHTEEDTQKILNRRNQMIEMIEEVNPNFENPFVGDNENFTGTYHRSFSKSDVSS